MHVPEEFGWVEQKKRLPKISAPVLYRGAQGRGYPFSLPIPWGAVPLRLKTPIPGGDPWVPAPSVPSLSSVISTLPGRGAPLSAALQASSLGKGEAAGKPSLRTGVGLDSISRGKRKVPDSFVGAQ